MYIFANLELPVWPLAARRSMVFHVEVWIVCVSVAVEVGVGVDSSSVVMLGRVSRVGLTRDSRLRTVLDLVVRAKRLGGCWGTTVSLAAADVSGCCWGVGGDRALFCGRAVVWGRAVCFGSQST
jgi:hypothetical protein